MTPARPAPRLGKQLRRANHLLRETERDVREGEGHNGLASVVQFIGRKT